MFNKALHDLIEQKLKESLQLSTHALPGVENLRTVMSYSLLAGGKRLRPILVLLCARLVVKNMRQLRSDEAVYETAMPAALAIEYVHTYSLIHDDLPSMDNDDFRRGKPSSHKAFDEAAAILAGDALLSDAFLLLSGAENNAAKQCAQLALACGSVGMVAGQMADVHCMDEKNAPDTNYWLQIHRLKTGQLITCACVLGALSASANEQMLDQVRKFGEHLGLAFQLYDDLVDEAPLCKLLGKEQLRKMADDESEKALSTLSFFELGTEELKELVFNLRDSSSC